MHRANVTKRPVVYNDRLSVLDFRPKKRKLNNNKPTTPSPLAVQTPTPTPSTLSETAESESAGSREEVALTWDAAEFTEDLVHKCATLLLHAVAEGLGFGDESSGSESEADDEDDEDDEEEEEELEVADGDEWVAHGSEDDASESAKEDAEVLPEFLQEEDDETDDDWHPAGKPKPKKSPKVEKKPRARRKVAAHPERRGSTASVKTPVTRRRGKDAGEASETDAPSAESTPRSSLRGRKPKASI